MNEHGNSLFNKQLKLAHNDQLFANPRTLLIHGARAVLRVAEHKAQHADSWLAGVMGRRNHNVAAVALANKNARIVWTLLAQEREYEANYGVVA